MNYKRLRIYLGWTCNKCYIYEKQCFGPFENYINKFGSNFFIALNKKEFLKIKNYHIKNKKLCY